MVGLEIDMAAAKNSPRSAYGKGQDVKMLSTAKDPRSPPTPGSDSRAKKSTVVEKLPKLYATKVSGMMDKKSMGKGSIDEMSVKSGSSLDSKY